MTTRIALVPGDGIGPEIIAEAVKVLESVDARTGGQLKLQFDTAPAGYAGLRAGGKPLPDATLATCQAADAILFGTVRDPGGSFAEPANRPEQAIVALRKALGHYVNLRPVRTYGALAALSPLKQSLLDGGIDLLFVRELAGGAYYGTPRGVETGVGGERGFNAASYTTAEVARTAEVAFEIARTRRAHVTSVDKANVLEISQVWRRAVEGVAASYPDVTCRHMLVDNCAAALVRDPREFDVILVSNLFGDILSDEAAMLSGIPDLMPTAASGGAGPAIYEPMHDSRPALAGSGRANPLSMILCAAMMLRQSLSRAAEAKWIEDAVERVLARGYRTPDLAAHGTITVGTAGIGDLIAREIAGGTGPLKG
ncbi:MAG: 3-isopropylmalate dehydrogenase [Chloroflexota bacterium]